MSSGRSLALVFGIIVAACGGRASEPTYPTDRPLVKPGDDLSSAKAGAKRVDASQTGLVAKDPRIVDLDIIRVKGNMVGPEDGGSVATADLFREANEQLKNGKPREAMAQFRRLVTEFPESKYAPLSLFNIAAAQDSLGDRTATIATLRELVAAYPNARESIEGHLYIAALQAEHQEWADALVTLDAVVARQNLTNADRVEAYARKGYVQLELKKYDDADAAFGNAVAEWRRATRIDDPYYIAMAHYYRGEIAHRKFTAYPVRLPDAQLQIDLEQKRVLAVQAYERWKESLGFKHAYWATASGYQMSQIFVELWEATVKAPWPTQLAGADRPKYAKEIHDRVREHLEKALEGHRMNVELAKAYGVDTSWSKGSAAKAVEVMQKLDADMKGNFVTPP
ncbi:MAG TPA: tetratricopeptide repeat protein [Candidatus Limnocylindrales bacterium]|nr:tetratricopeptide repeat protein [Candidatus Limnocylindrales bacterium]